MITIVLFRVWYILCFHFHFFICFKLMIAKLLICIRYYRIFVFSFHSCYFLFFISKSVFYCSTERSFQSQNGHPITHKQSSCLMRYMVGMWYVNCGYMYWIYEEMILTIVNIALFSSISAVSHIWFIHIPHLSFYHFQTGTY